MKTMLWSECYDMSLQDNNDMSLQNLGDHSLPQRLFSLLSTNWYDFLGKFSVMISFYIRHGLQFKVFFLLDWFQPKWNPVRLLFYNSSLSQGTPKQE